MESLWPTIFSVLFGAVIGTLFSYFSNKRESINKNKKELCFKMYDEFHSDTMLEARLKADKYLLKHKKLDFDEIMSHKNPEFYHVARVFHFFSKLSMLYKYKQINEGLSRDFFKLHYGYWYSTHFSRYEHKMKNELKFAEIIEIKNILSGF